MIIIAPTVVSLIATILLFFFWSKKKSHVWINLFATAFYLLFSLILFFTVWQKNYVVLRVGGWNAPYGIALCADQLGALMLLFTAIIAFSVAVYGIHGVFRLLRSFTPGQSP